MSKKTDDNLIAVCNCYICIEIRRGCEAEAQEAAAREAAGLNREQCAVCLWKGYYINPLSELPVICTACKRGFRMKLWVAHEKAQGHWVPEFEAAA